MVLMHFGSNNITLINSLKYLNMGMSKFEATCSKLYTLLITRHIAIMEIMFFLSNESIVVGIQLIPKI